MSEQTKLSNNKEILAYLAEKFPKCFILEGEARPLKIGIFHELVEALKDEERCSKTQLRQVLRHYTSNWRYLHGCRTGSIRVDLQGVDCGVLEEEHVAHAAEQLKSAKDRVAERRAAQREEQKLKRVEVAKQKKARAVKIKTSEAREGLPKAKKIAQPKLKPATSDILSVGDHVQVKVSEKANSAVVVELNKDSVIVQLQNGLIINVNIHNIFLTT